MRYIFLIEKKVFDLGRRDLIFRSPSKIWVGERRGGGFTMKIYDCFFIALFFTVFSGFLELFVLTCFFAKKFTMIFLKPFSLLFFLFFLELFVLTCFFAKEFTIVFL